MDDADGNGGPTNGALPIDDLVDYCHTQAGLLSGHVDTMVSEADELLDEIDERTAEIRSRLEGLPEDVEATETPTSVTAPAGAEVDLAEIEALQDDLEEKQLLVEAKHSRMQAFQELAAGYTELADELTVDVDSDREAVERIVEFESETDAPTYFDERETLLEVAARASDEGADEP
ncbi:hypothetical protein [Natronobacterium gregoryi]|uniref:Uncharacterized protein n=2 Tax=Natronobacterium gregoryi TaxID=44930 RepID=L0AJR9_NATGS|nr:hypothetical protein [Natronobacterium gregoryi]AFZ73300.1 hypothetical protein Natgr_2118 [Natronobacterium gregoryi SP2]ELY73944.1 hypothetical protein C490_00835 [Natronobacterium gregoryi SP2]PLK19904.1 hypothetical protein CYV19_12420 [Natronobacterium gregoryi SP2]SFJ37900.1 hypothetical protein SAMN05443661_12535 [Natronobacterium gregoryi]